MKTLLQITSSLNADAGQSTRLAKRFVAAWRELNPDGEVIVRDLAKQPVPHLDDARFAPSSRSRASGRSSNNASSTIRTG